jgi:hypothetical protein
MENLSFTKRNQNQMKIIWFMSVLCICLSINTYAQRIVYAYDDAGNRISRQPKIVIQSSSNQLRSAADTETFEEILSELKISIYPNPTHGVLKIDISGGEIPENAQIYLYTITGRLIGEWENLSTSNIIDISSQSTGNYLMKIVLDDDHISDWKIIKK